MKKCVARLTTSLPEIGAAFVAGMKPTLYFLLAGRGPFNPILRIKDHNGIEGTKGRPTPSEPQRCGGAAVGVGGETATQGRPSGERRSDDGGTKKDQ